MLRIRSIFIHILIISATISATQSFSIFGSNKDVTSPKPDTPVTNDYSTTSNNNDDNNNSDKDDAKKGEHGTLGTIGRGIVKGIDKTVGKIRDGVSSAVDKVENGVGRAIDSVVKGTNSTINKVHDGVEKVVDTVEKIKIKISNTTLGLDTNTTFFSGVVENFKEKVSGIYPGTKWCGGGDIARGYDDLGKFAGTDACCREHDLCPDNIPAGQSKYGLINTGLFTRSHCDCDTKFHECLKKDGSVVSKKIGFTYFTILGPQCFKKDYAIIDCNRSEDGKCIDYECERSGQQVYQWFDNPTF